MPVLMTKFGSLEESSGGKGDRQNYEMLDFALRFHFNVRRLGDLSNCHEIIVHKNCHSDHPFRQPGAQLPTHESVLCETFNRGLHYTCTHT